MVEIAVRIVLLAWALIGMPSGSYFEPGPPIATAYVEVAGGNADALAEQLTAFAKTEGFTFAIYERSPGLFLMTKPGASILVVPDYPPHRFTIEALRHTGGESGPPKKALDALLKLLTNAEGITIVPK